MNMIKKILLVSSVLLCMLMLCPGVLADPTGTAPVTGNPALTLSLTVTGSQTFGDMNPGDNVNTTVSNSVVANVTTNAPWTVTVVDATNNGKMAEYDGSSYTPSGKVLTDALNVGSSSASYVTLANTPSAAVWTGTAGTYLESPYFKQTVEMADSRVGSGHNYRVVTTFTASAV
jgi:hypothetical protein